MVNRGCRPTSRLTITRNIGPYVVCVYLWVKCWSIYWPSSIILSVEYWLSVSWQINQQLVIIASVMYRHIFVNGCSSIGPVLVNNQHHLYNILVPKAFSFVTRYLSNDMWWTLLLITHTGCCGYQIDHELPNIGLFSCIGQHLACLCQHISHYVGLVSVECYIDWHAEQNLTKVLAVTWTKCQWKVGDLTEISQQSRDWLSTIDWSSWLPVETCSRLLTKWSTNSQPRCRQIHQSSPPISHMTSFPLYPSALGLSKNLRSFKTSQIVPIVFNYHTNQSPFLLEIW